MKKISRIFLFSVLVMLTGSVSAQTIKDVFNKTDTKLTWLGVDFTRARLIGDAVANEVEIRDKQFAGINDVVVNEPKRYDIAGAFHKSTVETDLGPVAKRNEKANAAELKSTNSSDFSRLKEADITAVVKGFDFGKNTGIGVLFVMEGMNKTAKAASIWVTFIDMKSKKVLLTERFEAKSAGGFSWRNYWASTVRTMLETIEKKKYNDWKKQYS